MRWLGWVVVTSVLLVAPGCAARPPVAPLGHVSEPHALRVRFRPEPPAVRVDLNGGTYRPADTQRLVADARDSIDRFNVVLADTLRRAGYEVTADGPCDVSVVRELYFDTEPRQARHGHITLSDIARVIFHVYDATGNEIERFELHPTETPEGVAVDLVNAMLRSPKVASYAETRKKSGPAD